MTFREDQLKIAQYLQTPNRCPRPDKDEDKHFVYLITYLGELFVQGYRIIEQFADILVFSLMEFQSNDQTQSRYRNSLPPRFKVVMWQISDAKIFESGKQRREIYNRLLSIGKWLEQVEYNIIFLHTFRYSILNAPQLERATLPNEKFYYTKIQWIVERNGLKPIHEKDEGIALHKLAELFLKGAGQARNPLQLQKMQKHNKFVYDLFKVVNTVCYIIGKQFLQNNYQTLSSQKWMRWSTCKKFKRFDLLLRNQQKSCIIDWKFSRLQAQEKIRGTGINKKNKVYYQLASKDFKTNVELKFYCFHERHINHHYHMTTCATYLHKIDQIQIDDPTIIYELDADSDSSMDVLRRNVIVPSDDDLEMIQNVPQIIARPIVEVHSTMIDNSQEGIEQISKTDYERNYQSERKERKEKSVQDNNKTKRITKQRPKKLNEMRSNAIEIDSD